MTPHVQGCFHSLGMCAEFTDRSKYPHVVSGGNGKRKWFVVTAEGETLDDSRGRIRRFESSLAASTAIHQEFSAMKDFYGKECDGCGENAGELWCATCENIYCIECICEDLADLINELPEHAR